MDRLVEFGAAASAVAITLLIVLFGFITLVSAFRFRGTQTQGTFTIASMVLGATTPLTLVLFVSLALTLDPVRRDPLLRAAHLVSIISLVLTGPLLVLAVNNAWQAWEKSWKNVFRFAVEAAAGIASVSAIAVYFDVMALRLTPTTASADFVDFVANSLVSGFLYIAILGVLLVIGTLIAKNRPDTNG